MSRKTPTVIRLAGSPRWEMTGEVDHLTTTLLRPERVNVILTNSGLLFGRWPVLGSGPRWSRPREQHRALKNARAPSRPGINGGALAESSRPAGRTRLSSASEGALVDRYSLFSGRPSGRKSARHPIGVRSPIFRAGARASSVVIFAKRRQSVGSSRHRLVKVPGRHRRLFPELRRNFSPQTLAPFRSQHPDAARRKRRCFSNNPSHPLP
jgi:hypothetical protein